MNKVLLVTDNERILRPAATRLEAQEWEVYLASSENEVFDSCVTLRPSMVIVDVEMGGAEAFRCIGTARVLYPDLYIVAITRGGKDKLWPGAAAVCGANRFVDGPVSKSNLAESVESGFSQGLINPTSPPDTEECGWFETSALTENGEYL
jgi:DNA-binding NtrC family response regulator